MKNRHFSWTATLLLAFFSLLGMNTLNAQHSGMVKKKAQIAAVNLQKDTFMVLGNCGMCQKVIQTAALQAGAAQANWNIETDQLSVAYDTTKTSLDAIQRAVAQSGYDNAGYKADDATYEKLHACCHYERTGAAGSTILWSEEKKQ